METKKQTAVEWLEEIINNHITMGYPFTKEIEQAKAMEKEQIIDACNYGCSDWGSWKDSEQYYNETYGK